MNNNIFKNPTRCRYTWSSNTNPPVHCCLDYFFLVSFNLLSQIEKWNISYGFMSDHSSVSLLVMTVDEAPGRGFFGIQNYTNYVNMIKGVLMTLQEIIVI